MAEHLRAVTLRGLALRQIMIFLRRKTQKGFFIVNKEWFERIDWSEYDITKEFRKEDDIGKLSIQDYVNKRLTQEGVDYCYYDHGTGEIADFISGRIESHKLVITLYHCKGSSGKKPGNRVGDIYEVCEQVIKSSIWLSNVHFKEKVKDRYLHNDNPFSYRQDKPLVLKGLMEKVHGNVEYQLVIVQPGISINKLQKKMEPTLAACNTYCVNRGYREIKVWCKEYVVVLDFIGNYRNNFMIPIALSGDRTYNKDTVRHYVTEGSRIIPGSSTLHFDEISKKKIFSSIDNANFSDIKLIKENYFNLKNKLGHIPALTDFDKYGEMDVLRIFDNNSLGSYYKFLVKYDPDYKVRLSDEKAQVIEFICPIYCSISDKDNSCGFE